MAMFKMKYLEVLVRFFPTLVVMALMDGFD
jgi:hypothetical protein